MQVEPVPGGTGLGGGSDATLLPIGAGGGCAWGVGSDASGGDGGEVAWLQETCPLPSCWGYPVSFILKESANCCATLTHFLEESREL